MPFFVYEGRPPLAACLLLSFLSAATSASAADALPADARPDDASRTPASPGDDADALDRILVTASRTARPATRALAAATVIDRADIERLQPRSLQDLLAGRAGLALANNGGEGKATSLFVRGTESDHVLVLVDGVKLGSATTGSAALQDLPPEQIERIEIVRGPFSSLYGSDAIGGVIQIFTRRPQGAAVPSYSIAAGSEGARRATFGVGGRSSGEDEGARGGWYALNAAHARTDGINAYRGPRNFDPDRDGYRNASLTLQGGYRFDPRWDVEARVFRAEGRNEYDGGASNVSDTVQQVVGGRLRYAPNDALRIALSLGGSADLSDNYRNAAYASTFDTRRRMASLQADLDVGDGLLTVGLDWLRDSVSSSTRYARDRRTDRGAFVQWQDAFGAQSLQLALRRDRDSQSGGVTTGSASWGWEIRDGLQLTARYGTAFKAPTFNELYFPGYGNSQLRPERARSVELGVRGGSAVGRATGQWSLNAFETRIDDLIAYDADLRPAPGPNNIDRARIRGIEAAGEMRLADWRLGGSLTWLDPRAEGGVNDGNRLPRRPSRSGRIDLDRSFERLSFGASVTAAGARDENLANTRRMHGYGLLGLRVGLSLSPRWSLQLSADNALDRRYETAEFYNQPGRQWLLALRHHPDAR